MYVKLSGSCLKQDKIIFNQEKTVNIYILYDLKSNLNKFDPTLQNSDFYKYEYAGYGIGFNSKGTSSHPSGGTGVNVVFFGANMNSSVHANNKTKNLLILGEGFTQGLEDTTLYAEKMHSIIFTPTKILSKFAL